MKSDIITIDNQGNGFENALRESKKVAEYRELGEKETMRLQLFTEEMLSMVHSVTGEMKGSFWIESELNRFELNLTTKTVLDKEKRHLLISSTTSRKNEAANSFLGKLRNAFEEAMASDVERNYFELPAELQADLAGRPIESTDQEWDRYERSVLLNLADDVKIYIRGGLVHMTIIKDFAK